MKKITGFFLAFLPLFVMILLFVSGLVIKDYAHVFVTSVEITETSCKEQKTEDDVDPTHQLHVNVLPHNATNPEVYYKSSDESILKVSNEGLVTCLDYGEASIYAVSKENELISSKCDFEVWDDKVHSIAVDEKMARYVGFNQTFNLNAKPVPATHLQAIPVFEYTSSDETVVKVSPDGEVYAQQQEGDATITITTKNEFWNVKRDVNVHVGVGVNAIDLADPSNITIQKRNYNFYDDIMTYPEKKEEVPFDDFEYSSSDPSAASINEKGEINFKKPDQPVTFTAKYIRNDLSISKVIESTCEAFQNVIFNRYSFVGDINDYKVQSYLDPKDVNFHTFPESDQFEGLDITSSNPNVIVVEGDKFKVVGCGTTILTVTAKPINNEYDEKTDSCFVTIYDPNEQFIVSQNVKTPDNSFRYYLRDNIIKDSLSMFNEDITWNIVQGEEVAWIDENDILHFKQPNTAVVIDATLPTKSCTGQFTVRCESMTTTTIDITTDSHFTIEVDKRYVFKNRGVTWYPDQSYLPNFTKVTDEDGQICYIPKAGRNYVDFELNNGDIIPETKTINLIIIEKPVDVDYTKNSLYFATPQSVIPIDSLVKPLPASATTSTGQPAEIKTSFNPEDPTKVKIENNTLTFTDSTNVDVKATVDNHEFVNFRIKSTYLKPGKFSLADESGIEIASGAQKVIAPGQSLTLYSSQIYSDFELEESSISLFDIKSNSGNDFITFNKEWDSANSRICFTFTANQTAYGNDVITISTGTFKYYLNIQFAEQITGFDVFYKNIELLDTPEGNSTYINRLVLDVIAKPIKAKNRDFKASLIYKGTEEELTVTEDSKIDLNGKLNQFGEYIIKLTATDAGQFTKKFKIIFKDIATITDFKLKEAVREDDVDKVFIDCGAVSKTMTMDVDGIVDDQFYDDNFSINFTAKSGETIQPFGKYIYLNQIDSPTDANPGYENEITITLNTPQNIAHTYKLSREIVSRIEFPGHDNRDPEDAKGLQKVRVFATQSCYSEEEGLLSYYKLPLNLYNYKGELIEDTDTSNAKQEAFNTLVPESNGRVNWNYHHFDQYNEKSFLEISFTDDSALPYKDLYDNKFATPDNKNAIFSLSTHSKIASATYTFVVVNGLNVFCPYAFETDSYGGVCEYCNFKVLHSNVGLQEEARDNIPIVNPNRVYWYYSILGNGYTVNLNGPSAYLKSKGKDIIWVDIILNASFIECYDNQLDNFGAIALTDTGDDQQDKYGVYYAYSTFKSFKKALRPSKPKVDTYIKNCLFYQNKYAGVELENNNETGSKTYIQDCVMFDCACSSIINFDSVLYVKGFIDLYNFKGKEILTNIEDMDLSFLFPLLVDAAKEAGTLHIAADGSKVINSCYISEQTDTIFFWNEKTGQYESIHDTWPEEKYYWKPFFKIDVSWMGYKPSIWGSVNYRDHAPNYYDEFDAQGRLRWDFLNNQLYKLRRIQTLWY